MIRSTFLGLACLLAARPAAAQDGLTLSGSTRVRYEAIEGQARVGIDPSGDLVTLRTILSADYDAGRIAWGAELYDSRAYAADPGTPLTTSEVNALELVQAWAAVELPGALGRGSRMRVQVGRFLLNLGSRRLVAADDYRNTTTGFTGVHVDLGLPHGTEATLIYTLPQRRRPDDPASLADNEVSVDHEGFDQVLWGGTARTPLGPTAVELTFLHLGERDRPGRPTRERSLDSIGARLFRSPRPGRPDHEVEVIHQTGSVRAGLAPDAASLGVSAWLAHAEAGYSIAGAWRPRLSVAFDYASGDRGGGRFNRFDTLFGTRRGDLGPSGLYSAIGRANILTPGLRVEVTPSRRVDLFVAHRLLWLAARADAFSTTGVRDAAGRSGRYAGHQLDVRTRWWVIPDRLRAEVDAALLFKGRFLRTAPNAPRDGDTRYLSLNLLASF